jgi:CBS domain-containing protein
MNISDILRWKATTNTSEVFTAAPTDSVKDLLRSLADHDIGALVVVEEGAVVGVISERDVVRRLGQEGADVLERPVRDLMTTSVVTCASTDSIDTVAETMTQRRIRHMPVMSAATGDGADLVGIVSIGDVVSHRIRQLEKDRGQLEQYISG